MSFPEGFRRHICPPANCSVKRTQNKHEKEHKTKENRRNLNRILYFLHGPLRRNFQKNTQKDKTQNSKTPDHTKPSIVPSPTAQACPSIRGDQWYQTLKPSATDQPPPSQPPPASCTPSHSANSHAPGPNASLYQTMRRRTQISQPRPKAQREP